MKRKEKYNNNRGAALISVMIAVTFITIVASALLYMAYMNFTMKAMSVQSKTNFYETEGYLQGVTVKLQDEIAKSPDPATTMNNLTESANYSAIKLLKLKYPTATGNAASASVVIDGDTITLERGGSLTVSDESSKTKKYTLSDVKITQVNTEGLTNNIKTDIVYYVTKETTPSEQGGIGEFSMMMDGSLTSSGSEFTFMTLYGNSFLSDAVPAGAPGNSTGKTIPGHNALNLSGGAKLNIAGDYCVVYGDINLSDNAVLTVTQGNLCVYGDIHLNGNSTLICSGKIYMVSTPLTDYGRTDATSITAADGNLNKHLYPAGLTVQPIERAKFDNVVNELKFNDSDSTNDGLINQILKPDGIDMGSGIKLHYYDLTNKFSVTTTKFGKTMGWGCMGAQTDLNGSDLNDKLIFVSQPNTKIKDTSFNSTVISRYPITYQQAHGVSLSKIGPDMFKVLSVKSTDTTNILYDSTLNHYGINYSKDGHNFNNFPISAGDFFVDDADGVVNRILDNSSNGGGGGAPLIISSVTFDKWTKDSED